MAKGKPVVERALQEKHGRSWRAESASIEVTKPTRKNGGYLRTAHRVVGFAAAVATVALVHYTPALKASAEAAVSSKDPQSISQIINCAEPMALHGVRTGGHKKALHL